MTDSKEIKKMAYSREEKKIEESKDDKKMADSSTENKIAESKEEKKMAGDQGLMVFSALEAR